MTDFEKELVAIQPQLLFFARRFTDEPEDLVQFASMRALEKREQYKPGTNFRAWIFTILRNHFLSEKRRNWRWQDVEELPTAIALPTQENRQELRDTLRAIETLSASHQEVLYLIGMLQHDYIDIAEMLGRPEGTVKSQLHRARIKLTEKLH